MLLLRASNIRARGIRDLDIMAHKTFDLYIARLKVDSLGSPATIEAYHMSNVWLNVIVSWFSEQDAHLMRLYFSSEMFLHLRYDHESHYAQHAIQLHQ